MKRSVGKSIVVLLIALAVFLTGCSQEQALDISLRAAINLAINSAVAENEDAARVVEHMQARIKFEMISTKTTNKGVDALYRVSSPDLTAFIEDFDANDYATQEEMVEAIINGIEAAPITEKEVTVGFQNGVPVEYEDFLYAYSGGSYGLIADMQGGINNNGNNGNHNGNGGNNGNTDNNGNHNGNQNGNGNNGNHNGNSGNNGNDGNDAGDEPTKPPVIIIDPNRPTEPEASQGLAYALSEDGSHYIVIGIGSCTDADIVIPSKINGKPVMVIEQRAFYQCNQITSVRINSDFLHNGVQSIRNGAFRECQALKTVSFGNSVHDVSENAFIGCKMLESIEVDEDNLNLKSVDGNLLRQNGEIFYLYPANKTENSFAIPEGVESICGNAFAYAKNLNNVVIPDGVTYIGSGAFRGCLSLKSITIPATVSQINTLAFQNCAALKNVYFGGTVAQWEAIVKQFDWNINTSDFTVHCKDGKAYESEGRLVDIPVSYDRVVIKYPVGEKYVTGAEYLYIKANGNRQMEIKLSENKADAIAYTIVKNNDGTFSFMTDCGKFLYCDSTNTEFVSQESEYTKFVLKKAENGYYIRCATALYGDTPQYLEIWANHLTKYGIDPNRANKDIFVLDFEDAAGAAGTVVES
jgi:hypothetical protein